MTQQEQQHPTKPQLVVRESLLPLGIMAVLIYGIYDDDVRLLDVLGDESIVVSMTIAHRHLADARSVYQHMPTTRRLLAGEWQKRGYIPQTDGYVSAAP